jgi:glutaredoxin
MSEIAQIILYSKNNCGYCIKAKNLLESLGLDYTEKKFEDFSGVEKLIEDIGKNVKSMPQIKINGELIGGYNQLIEYLVDKHLVNFRGERINQEGKVI